MKFITTFLLNQLLNRDKGSMDFKHLEKSLFACILLMSLLVALIIAFVNSLLSLTDLYFLSLGFSEKELAFINMGMIAILICATIFTLRTCLKGSFKREKRSNPINTMPTTISNCVADFIQGYKEV